MIRHILISSFMLATVSAHAQTSAYADGVADRARITQWFEGLRGDYHDGAFFWSGQRSLAQPKTCEQLSISAEWHAGCVASRRVFAPMDVRRRSEPEYRRGWNGLAPTAQVIPPLAGNLPQTNTPPPTVIPQTPPYPAPLAPAPAATLPAPSVATGTFSSSDVREIVDASQGNDLRFNRDYRGRDIVVSGGFENASSAFLGGGFTITISVGSYRVLCDVSDAPLLEQIANWRQGQAIIMTGKIRRTILGSLILDRGCAPRAR